MKKHNGIRPQDVVILLKIVSYVNQHTSEIDRPGNVQLFRAPKKKSIAEHLLISPSEVTESLARSAYGGLYDPDSERVMSRSLLEFLQYGLKYVFPQQPGALVRGIPTAHSAKPLSELIQANEHYVWPDADGTLRGQAIEPLYHTVGKAVANDPLLYEMLALVDCIRVGKAREVALAVEELKKRLLPGQ